MTPLISPGIHQEPPRVIEWRPARTLGTTTLLFWLIGLALSAPILSSPHFPSEDGPAYLYWTSVYRDLAHQEAPFASMFERNTHWNSPNLAYFAIQYGLSGWLEPHAAERLILVLLLLWWVGAIHALSLATAGRITQGSFAALLLFHNWSLYMGFFSFLFGIPCFVCGVAVLAKLIEPGSGPQPAWRYFLLGGLALLAYYLHLVPGVLLTGAILLAALLEWRHDPVRARRLLVTAAPAILLVVGFVLASPFGEGGATWAVRSTIKRFVGFAFWRGFATPDSGFWATLLLFAATCVVLCLGGLRSWRKGEMSAGSRFVMMLAACLTVVYFVAPIRVGIGGFLNDRVHLALLSILLPVAGVTWNRKLSATVGVVLALLFGWQVVDFSLRAHRFGQEFGSLMRDAEAIPNGSTIEYVQPYEASRFENSFVAPFMDGGEIAYHCHCALVGNYWQNSPFYWVRTKPGQSPRPDFLVSFDRVPAVSTEPTEGPVRQPPVSSRLVLRVEPAPKRP